MPSLAPRRRLLLAGTSLLCAPASWCAPLPTPASAPPAPDARAAELPDEVRQALRQAKLPEQALSVWVGPVEGPGAGLPWLQWQAQRPVNPASVFKLVTTFAALERLGPAFVWRTPVRAHGEIRNGVLHGHLSLQGSGDPTLVVERLWLLLRRLRQLGLDEVRGDWVLDRSAFGPIEGTAADFDGDASRPYNVRPDALLLNLKALQLTFTPEPDRGVARVSVEPPLAGYRVDGQVRLAPGDCEDWRSGLQANLADPARLKLAGRYPTRCEEKTWPIAYADPASYNARLLQALWREAGGRLRGQVRDGPVPAGGRWLTESVSPPLAQVVRDINKFSNNVMAEQLFLTLATQDGSGPATPESARASLWRWVRERLGEPPEGTLVIDNGSGLSRQTRVTAAWLAQLLHTAWHSPVMPELLASLPVSGLDGTLRRSNAPAGQAHLKTGSLRDAACLAGYVLGTDGRRRVLVAMAHHEQAQAARPALDALVAWAVRR